MKISLQVCLRNIIQYAYPELTELCGSISLKSISSFAHVIITQDGNYQIRCDSGIKMWPEPAIIGLLAHELCHVVLRNTTAGERETDECVIARGLGQYLAFERIYTEKYKDHLIKSGRDKYLGYENIRKQLKQFELSQLDNLLADLKLIPSDANYAKRIHDTSLQLSGKSSNIYVDGIKYTISNIPHNSDISIVLRENSLEIFVDDCLFETFTR